MAKVNDPDDITIRWYGDNFVECSTITDRGFKHHYYLFCTEKGAKRLFKTALRKGEI